MVIDWSDFDFENVTFSKCGNPFLTGGGLFWKSSNTTIWWSVFDSNTAWSGGAIGLTCSPSTAVCNI